MGIYDRDYYRNEGPSIFDSLVPSGLVCRWLIGINVVVFIFQMLTRPPLVPGIPEQLGWFTDWFILDPRAVVQGEVWRLLTYAFLHSQSDLLHLLFNMIFLWWFGSDLEQLYGRKEFLAFYLVSALCGGLAFQAWSIAQGDTTPCLGASGAVTALLILCACHFPRRTILLFMIVPIPIWLFAVFSVARDAYTLLSEVNSNAKSGVAVSVHLAGAAFALVYYNRQMSITEWFRSFMFWNNFRARPRLKIYDPAIEKQQPVAVSAITSPPLAMDEHLEAKLDAVLEKIARTGKDSLTEQEQKILQQAAEMYKRRRT